MILTTTRHGRTSRDVRNLKSHLSKNVDQIASVAAIGNVPLSDADAALAYMEAMRDGSRASVSMHHIAISPLHRLTEVQRDETVQRILSAMGAEDHAWILWEHDGKARSERAADQHFHLVVGHVGPDGKALSDGWSYLRLEAAARSLEHDFGEPLTPSRKTAAVASILREQGRDDVADRLVAPDDGPRSAMSSAKRAVASRAGVDLPKVQASVRAAWSSADGPAAFRAAIAEQGLEVVAGTKPGVWIVRSGSTEIGALDRITREKRVAVQARMTEERTHAPAAPEPTSEAVATPAAEGASASDARDDLGHGEPGRARGPSDARGRAEVGSAPRAPGGAGERPAGSARGAEGSAGSGAPESTAPDGGGRGPAQSRRRDRVRDRAQVRALRGAATPRLRSLAADLREVSRPAIDRVRDALERRRSAAAAVFDRPLPVVPLSPALIAAAKAVKDAKRASTELYYGNARAVQAAEARRDAPEPRGLLARVLGRHAAWRRDRDDAAEFVRRFERAHSDALDRLDRATRAENRLAVPHHAVQRDVERRHEDEKRRAAQELRDIAAARDLLAREPALARFGEDRVLAEARRERDVASHRPAPLPEPIQSSGPRM